MKKSFYLLFVVFLFGGCQPRYLGKFPIPDNLRSVLKDRDTLCYKDSMTSRIDTFVITVLDHFVTEDESGDYENISIDYNRVKSTSKHYMLNSCQSGTGVEINAYGYYFDGARINQTYNIRKNIKINGITYPDIYIVSRDYLSDTIPKIIYFTFQQGILRYDYPDGRHYDRISK